LVENYTTQTCTYLGITSTHVFDDFKGLRIDQRYTGVPQEDGAVLVAVVGEPVTVSRE
jgi:hypothetical protein